MKVLTISSSNNTIGGAARVSFDLHSAFRLNNPENKMLVGKKSGLDTSVIPIKRSVYRKAVSWLLANDFSYFDTDYILSSQEFLDADVVHCHNLNGWYFNLNTLRKMAKIKPVIWTLHDMWALTAHSGHTDSEEIDSELLVCSNCNLYPSILWNNDRALRKRKKSIYLDSSFKIIVPCDWLASKVNLTCLSKNMIGTIPNGVNTKIFYPEDKVSARSKLKIEADKIVLFVGAGAEKNIYKGFSDFEWLAKNYKGNEVKFIAIGGDENAVISSNFEIIQATNNQDLLRLYYSAADALALTSTHEVFPLVVLEALACGLPVISYDVGGVSEILEGLPFCKIVPPGDRAVFSELLLASLLESSKNRLVSSKVLSQHINDHYSTSVMISQYFDIFNSVMKDG